MSDFQQAALIGGSIATVVIASQLGRRDLSWHKVVYPLLSVVGFGYGYLHGAPTARPELWLYAAAVGLGLVFGALATATTRVDRDATSGKVMTTCGTGFVATWLVALAARLVFIWAVEHDMAFREQVGTFMMSHEVHEAAIAPFFVIWALTMVLARLAAVLVRAGRLPGAPVAGRVLVAA